MRLWHNENGTEGSEDNILDDRVSDLEVLCDSDLAKYSDNKSQQWKRIRYIQTCIRSKTGVGKPIIIQFYAPLPVTKPGDKYATIRYDYRSQGDEISMIRNGDDYGYCIKQCYKICYYIQKMHNIDILKMRGEFAKDDNGTIWFMYANQIHRRDVPGVKLN